jgi:hypothetical protein
MENRKKQRITALKAVNGLMNVEMSGLRLQQRKADEQLSDLKQKQTQIDGEIGAVECRLRAALDSGANLIIDEYRMLISYLDYKQRTRINNERQQKFARERLKRVEDEMIHQGLLIRGIENLLKRRHKELQLETENKQLSLFDDAWLERQGDGP